MISPVMDFRSSPSKTVNNEARDVYGKLGESAGMEVELNRRLRSDIGLVEAGW